VSEATRAHRVPKLKFYIAIAAAVPNLSKPRDAAELQDLYRSVLTASWCRQPDEHSAEEVIDDIFNGGNGWKTKPHNVSPATDDEEDDDDDIGARDTIRARDVRRITHNLLHPHHHSHSHRSPSRNRPANGPHGSSHRRTPSNSSDKSFSTVTVTPSNRRKGVRIHERHLDHARSMASMTSTMTMDSDPMREVNYKGAREVREDDMRNDLVAWRLPGDQVM